MRKGRINFEDVLGVSGKKYDKWLEQQNLNYYLTYKSNLYADEFDYSIEREGCCSEPEFLTNDIKQITSIIDGFIKNKLKIKR